MTRSTSTEMRQWLYRFERSKNNPDVKGAGLFSSRWDLQNMSWNEIRDLEIPQLGEGMTFRKCCQALKRTWKSFKINKRYGTGAADSALLILRLQKASGFPLSHFEELEVYGGDEWVDNELSREEMELKQEENEEELDDAQESQDKGKDDSWQEWIDA